MHIKGFTFAALALALSWVGMPETALSRQGGFLRWPNSLPICSRNSAGKMPQFATAKKRAACAAPYCVFWWAVKDLNLRPLD